MGLASKLVLGFDVSSIGVGCAELIERVRDEMDASGDRVEGAMLCAACECKASRPSVQLVRLS